jgi:hypothetical protein
MNGKKDWSVKKGNIRSWKMNPFPMKNEKSFSEEICRRVFPEQNTDKHNREVPT